MPRKRFIALFAAMSILAGCAAPAVHDTPSTERPTDGVEVLDRIPTADLSTTTPMPLDGKKTCAANVPPEVVMPAGVDPTPILSDAQSCLWQGSGHAVEIGVLDHPMAEEIKTHVAMANGESTDRLAHLTWLRIDGHYAIERILEFDHTKACWLSLDLSSPAIAYVVTYAVDQAGEPSKSDTEASVNKFCPLTRQVSIKLLDHLDGDTPPWWKKVIHPTG